jgi:hypothetical protein
MDAYVKGIGEPAPSIHPFADEVLEAIWRHSLAFPRRPAFVTLFYLSALITVPDLRF